MKARVIPYFARQKLKLPDNIWKIIDISKEGLEKIKTTNEGLEAPDKDFGFEGVNLRTDDADFSDEEVIIQINY
jgi:hypothetical protein